MSIFSRLSNYVAARQARRQRIRTYMQIAQLPQEIRKDIGWPLADDREPAPGPRQHGP